MNERFIMKHKHNGFDSDQPFRRPLDPFLIEQQLEFGISTDAFLKSRQKRKSFVRLEQSETKFEEDPAMDVLERITESCVTSNAWRRYGEKKRKELLDKDQKDGGTTFILNEQCSIKRYFQLAARVTQQFDFSFERDEDLENTFIMGHRLITFLSDALPWHPDYMSSTVSKQRQSSKSSLAKVQDRVDILSHRIDEEQLNLYIMNDFDPIPDDESTSSSTTEITDPMTSFSTFESESPKDVINSFTTFESDSTKETGISHGGDVGNSFSTLGSDSLKSPERKEDDDFINSFSTFGVDVPANTEWEDFSGWSFHVEGESNNIFIDGTDSEDCVDQESCDMDFVDISIDNDESADSSSVETLPFENELFDDDDYSYIYGMTYLRRVGREEVIYECDSEADDSWAQEDGIRSVCSIRSTGSGPTYDPARIAFRELANRPPPRPRTPLEQRIEKLIKEAQDEREHARAPGLIPMSCTAGNASSDTASSCSEQSSEFRQKDDIQFRTFSTVRVI